MVFTRIFSNGKNKEKIHIVFYLILFFIILTVFCENFIAGTSFDLLGLRTIDDQALQASLRKYHEQPLSQITFMNDYGYGWFFWFPMYIITLPLYFVYRFAGIAWPLIVIPRMQSLFFSVLCLFLMYKIVSLYTKNKLIIVTAIFLMPIFPTGAYFAGRFGTNPQTAFFSMLSVWYVLKNSKIDTIDLRKVLGSFALAMGTKTSAIIIAPILILLVLERYGWKFNKRNIVIWIRESFFAFILMVFTISPAILLAPFNIQNATNSFNVLYSYVSQRSGSADIILNFGGFIGESYFLMAAVLLFLGLIYLSATQKYKRDFLWLFCGSALGILFLCRTIDYGSMYIVIYGFAISFVLPLGLIALEYINVKDIKIKSRIVSVICCLMCVQQLFFIGGKVIRNDSYSILAYYDYYMNNVSAYNARHNALLDNNNGNIIVFVDWSVPAIVSSLGHEDITYYTIWNDLGVYNQEVNNIVLDKKCDAMTKTQEELQQILDENENSLSQSKQLRMNDFYARQSLVYNNRLFDSEWKLYYEDEGVLMYRRIE